MAINAAWHAKHPMSPRATLAERAAWHVAHAEHCGCRPIPTSVSAYLREMKRAERAAAARRKRASKRRGA